METRDVIREEVYRESSRLAPGLIYALDIVCVTRYGKKCVDLLLDDPRSFLNTLKGVYDDASLTLILEIVFEKPLSKFGLKVKELLRGVNH